MVEIEEYEEIIPRDISWLAFNHRVLQEAMDDRVPLYERIKFLAIFSSNLDEFYRVRVASYRSLRQLKKSERVSLEVDVKPNRRLKEIRNIVHEQQEQFGRIFGEMIKPELMRQGIELLSRDKLAQYHYDFCKEYFEKHLSQIISVEYKDYNQSIFLENSALYLTGLCQNKLVVIKAENELDRFITIRFQDLLHHVAFIDDIIKICLEDDCPELYAIRLSRDAELYVEEDMDADIAARVKESLSNRNIGLPSRLLYDSKMPKALRKKLKNALGLSKYDMIPGASYHRFSDFFDFPDPSETKKLHDPSYPALSHPYLESHKSLWKAVELKDVLLNFPYQRFEYLLNMIQECIDDPDTKKIKMTLYRTGNSSPIIDLLLKALSRDIEVFVFVEVKARFDEAPNIYWGEQLREKGASVVYSIPHFKVHTKLMYFEKESSDGLIKRLSYVGTGNFNHKTAKIYCDHALLTTDSNLTTEIAELFENLERHEMNFEHFENIWVAPKLMRMNILRHIQREIEHAESGHDAYMILKMNNLQDKELIEWLYRASELGVRIKMIVRGICCLNSDHPRALNIEVVSIVDRYLEHARLFLFGNAGNEEIYMGSADWMTRNMDRRIEVLVPIRSRHIFRELRHLLSLQCRDNQKARRIDGQLTNTYKMNNGPSIRSQEKFYHFLEEKSKGLGQISSENKFSNQAG